MTPIRPMSSQSTSIKTGETDTKPPQEQTSAVGSKSAEREVCPECGDAIVTTDKERVCGGCGLVVKAEMVDYGPEWRAYSNSERKRRSRVGSPKDETLHDKGLSTTISQRDRDRYGNLLSGRKRRQMNRLRKWDKRMKKTSSDRNQIKGLNEIRRMASALNIPDDATETGAILYKRVCEEGMLPGRSIEAMASASLYAGTREIGLPRTLDEISQVSRVEKRQIGRCYRVINEAFELGIPPEKPEKYIPRFVSEAFDKTDGDNSPKSIRRLENMATRFIKIARDHNVHSGRNPISIAVAAVYLASIHCEAAITQKRLADVCDVSTVTIRNRYHDIETAMEKEDVNLKNGS